MSTLEALELAVRFPVPNRSTWEEAAQAELKATPLARLTRRSLEGVEIRPLYVRPDVQDRPMGIPWTQPAWKPVNPSATQSRRWRRWLNSYSSASAAH